MRFVLDLTLCREYQGRNAVGIVRVEREIAKFLANHENSSFVFFDKATCHFRCFTLTDVVKSTSSMMQGLNRSESDLRNVEISGRRFDFKVDDIFISCGLTWDEDCLRFLFCEKQRVSFKVVQVVYDLVPIKYPELCVPGMRTKFPKFLLDAAWTSDLLASISDNTQSDLERFLIKIETPKPLLSRIKMGIEPIFKESEKLQTETKINGSIFKRNISSFILFVSTIEPRKDHRFMFFVWCKLYEILGEHLPCLVMIGRVAWNSSDTVYIFKNSQLYEDGKAIIIESVNDEELHWLYKNCLFTVYPSLYEGWGLPITESLAYAKCCVVSDVASHSEASQGLAQLVRSQDLYAWVDACLSLITDDVKRLGIEKRIASERLQSSWSDCANDFVCSLGKLLFENENCR